MDIGALRHVVLLENPTGQVPDGEGGYTEGWAALSPARVPAAIKPATARDLERQVANSVQSTASHILTMRYVPGVTTATRITFGTRQFSVTGIQNTDERNIELVIAAVEKV